ncbi:MAG: hypothetical protein JWL59_63 [Chthoniobacteraceae bacterium]|nr:hypothetical protein [Chthoniobacteraceae bacterium]
MKPRLLPIYFEPGRDGGFDTQLANLQTLLSADAEFLLPVPLGAPLPECEAVVFPQLLGEAYRRVDDFRAFTVPVLVLTSEFATLSMWDWEIITYLKSEGAGERIVAPYHIDQTRTVLRALAIRQQLRTSKFVVYQDDPGEGMQAPIFKRFYWWETECVQRMLEKFGIVIEKRSFKKLGAAAKEIADADAQREWKAWNWPTTLPEASLNAAVKLYLAVKNDIGEDPAVQGVGINCLNESYFSDCTPCLAWSMFYEQRGLIWGCEADIVSMLTKLILHRSVGAPTIMTNLYPFLMGQAALKHERIADFPKVEGDPRNHILVAHCGYLGVVPPSFSTEWTLRPKVLAIVDEKAHAIDARLPEGPITLAKLHPDMRTMTVVEGELTGYTQYPGSDCLNGGVIRVPDGHRLMTHLASHHYLLMSGHHRGGIEAIGAVFGILAQIL